MTDNTEQQPKAGETKLDQAVGGDDLEQQIISCVEAAKLAGFNATSLSYDGRDGGYSNQKKGYYDSKDVVKDIMQLISRHCTGKEAVTSETLEEVISQELLTYAHNRFSPLKVGGINGEADIKIDGLLTKRLTGVVRQALNLDSVPEKPWYTDDNAGQLDTFTTIDSGTEKSQPPIFGGLHTWPPKDSGTEDRK